MPLYTRKAQVPLTEQQYQDLRSVAKEAQRSMGALLREAAEQVYLRQKQHHDKAQAVARLLSLPETDVPTTYEAWERQYLAAKVGEHG